MNSSIYRVSLDIHETSSQTMLNVVKGDNKRQFLFVLTENGRPYTIANNCTAVFRAKKPDGTVLYNNCTIDNSVIDYELTNQTSASVGIVECEVTLYGAGYYRKLDTNEAPTFKTNTYYSKSGDTYTLLASAPADWSTNWKDYYFFYTPQITSPRFALCVEDNLYSDSQVESQDEFTQLLNAIAELNNLDASVTKSGNTATITITKKNGTTQSASISDGAKGDDGDDGNGIAGISKTGTVGKVDTYTITYTNGTTSTFTVTNGQDGEGKGIESITKTSTQGLVDTYTITYTDATTSTFTVTNGTSGVYVGSGEMPADCNVQVDPTGTTMSVVQTTGQSTVNVMSQKAVTDALDDKQHNLTAGSGISISNNVISATGGGGGGAEQYSHFIHFEIGLQSGEICECHLKIIDTSNTLYQLSPLKLYLYQHSFSAASLYPATGVIFEPNVTTNPKIILGVYIDSNGKLNATYFSPTAKTIASTIIDTGYSYFNFYDRLVWTTNPGDD